MTSPFVTRFAGIVLLSVLVSAQGTLPKPAGRISDLANVIDAGTESELDRRLDELEQQTSHEVAVVTVPSLGGTTVEDYAERLFKEWGIGQAKQDNGVLVLVAPNEREMRIEVGYGLEGILPDGLAGEIVRDDFIPRFRNDDYNGGIRDGVLRVADIVEKQQVLTPEELARFNQSGGNEMPEWALVPFLGVFVTIGFGMIGLGIRTKTAFPLLFGSLFGGMPMLMSLVAGVLSFFILLAWAFFMFVVGYRLGGRPSWRDALRGTRGSAGNGWTMGNTSSSSSSSSSSSGGSSSSFGGGSSGGGGASGRW